MKLDGEKTEKYIAVKKLAEYLCKEGSFAEQFITLETVGEFIWNLTGGGKGIFIEYKPKTYNLNISCKQYDLDNDMWKTKSQDKIKLISPSTQLPTIKTKYTKILNNNMANTKRPLNEAKSKKYSEEEVDQLRRSLSALIFKFKSAFKQHVEDPSMIKKLDAVYKAVEDMPSVATMKNNFKKAEKDKRGRNVEEEIVVGTDKEAININKANPSAKVVVNPKAMKSDGGGGLLSEFIDDTNGYDLVSDVVEIYSFCKNYNNNPKKSLSKSIDFQWPDSECNHKHILFIDTDQNIKKKMCLYKDANGYKMGNPPVEQEITQLQESKRYKVSDVLKFLS